ncbi:MAG: hypothetical protein ACNA7H_02285, partial [Desulfotignum sp.]
MMHAAPNWAPPTAEQVGLIGTHWSKGWIIEDNHISHSTCTGITLGKHGDEFDNTSADTAEGYGLRQMAIQEKIPAAEPGILSFHNAVIDSIARYGRTHKLEIMMRYKLASKDLFSDIDLGFKMMSRRKLDLMPSRVKDKKSIRNIFNQNQTGR